jgi:hypothetical protein
MQRPNEMRLQIISAPKGRLACLTLVLELFMAFTVFEVMKKAFDTVEGLEATPAVVAVCRGVLEGDYAVGRRAYFRSSRRGLVSRFVTL